MKSRGKWQGMWTIVRFNWPFYLSALLVLIFSAWGLSAIGSSGLKSLLEITLLGSAYFLIGSLGVSHQVYDRSDLYRWKWLTRALAGSDPKHIIFCHSGFDETSQDLKQRFPTAEWQLLDHYDPALMTEASIRRARQHQPPSADTLTAPYDKWPVTSESADCILGLLAIHELRTESERIAWFQEAHRCLNSNGRVILAEHVRDLANFIAFGPGFLHFHSHASWHRCWSLAPFKSVDDFYVTPWIRIYVLQKA